MRLAVVLVVLSLSFAARGERRSMLEVGVLAAAEASLVLDALQTLDIKRESWGWEENPLLGKHPGDARVVGYFAGTMLLTGAAWYFLPRRLRILAPLVVLVVEVPQIERNARAGCVVRF